jgi:hypothetical protein
MSRSTAPVCPATLDIVVEDDENGKRLENARVRTAVGGLRGTSGRFEASGVPAGLGLQVTAGGYVPGCRTARIEEGTQTVRLRPSGSNRLILTLAPSPGRPIGLIDGLAGSECGVDIRSFELTQGIEQAGRFTFEILGLPPGGLIYRGGLGEPPSRVDVPGRLTYEVGPSCLTCK